MPAARPIRVLLAILGCYEVFSWIHSQNDRALLSGKLWERLPVLNVRNPGRFMI